jgi:hypothetical protein
LLRNRAHLWRTRAGEDRPGGSLVLRTGARAVARDGAPLPAAVGACIVVFPAAVREGVAL